MAPLIPDFLPLHLTDLILQKYLATTTGITDWLNFEGVANLAPSSDDSVGYAGVIWAQSLSSARNALRRTWNPDITWGIRLAIANTDAALVSRYALWWAYTLDDILESAATIEGQARYGTNLSGTFETVPVSATATLAIARQGWQIIIDENEDGGAVGTITSNFQVKG